MHPIISVVTPSFNQAEFIADTIESILSQQGDFYIDNKFTFEIGGKTKNKKQIYSVDSAFIVADNLEYGYENKIPLWLFGFLY